MPERRISAVARDRRASPVWGLKLQPMDAWAGASAMSSSIGTAMPAGARGGIGTDDAVAPAGPPRPENAYAQHLHGTRTPDAVAGVMDHPEWIVPKGTVFHCLPQQPLDTQLPGPVKCLVTDEVWSADGTNLLIERGSTVNGEMQRGLELGQDRAFILWTDLLTTHFVTVALDSPAADDLGQIGAPGTLNEHLWAKVKAAVLLTAVQTASNVATNVVQAAGTTSLSIGSYGPSLAEQALSHDLNIPTTLYRNQAQALTVYVNRNLDFSRAYRDEIRAGRRGDAAGAERCGTSAPMVAAAFAGMAGRSRHHRHLHQRPRSALREAAGSQCRPRNIADRPPSHGPLSRRELAGVPHLAVANGKNVVFAGEVGSGKTHNLRAFTNSIRLAARIVTIEDMPEILGLPHENVVNMFYSEGGQGTARIAAEDLIVAALRMGMDVLLMQELRNAAAFAYLRALASGHPGMTTCHAASAEGAFDAVRLMVKQHQAGRHLADDDVRAMLTSLIDVVAHCECRDGRYRMTEIWYDPTAKGKAVRDTGVALAAE